MLDITVSPCSVDNNNIQKIDEILSIKYNNKKFITRTRIIGFKSRTNYDDMG